MFYLYQLDMECDMENKDWINDYELLKQVSRANPYTAPDGYFDNLSDRIMSLKNIRTYTENTPGDGFTVPSNYFEDLTVNMQSRKVIDDAAGKEGTGFTVPDGYFEVLTSNIESRVAIEEAINKENAGFVVPEGYFEVLASNLQSRIALEELKEEEAGFSLPEGYFDDLASAIQSRIAVEEAIGEPAEIFTVPEGYFEQLNNNILDKTVNAEKIVRLKPVVNNNRGGIVRRLISSTAFKYATAACFAVAIGSGVLLTQIGNKPNDHLHSFLHKQLSTVPINDIKSYLQLNVDAGDAQQTMATEGANVNDQDLKDALQSYADSVQ